MSWATDLDKKLEKLMQQKQKDVYEVYADAMIEHAHGTIYNGPPKVGDMYCGWPVMDLLDLVPPHERPAAAAALIKKVTPLMAHSISGAGRVGYISQDVMRRQHSLEEMMAMRMRWGQGVRQPKGFIHMAMHGTGDVVHIWIITKDGQSLVLEDEAGLYPSDTLITKIRLLQRGE